MAAPSTYLEVNRALNYDENPRQLGYELEFTGITPDEAAELIAQHFDADIDKVSEAEFNIPHPEFGDFRIELDWHFGRRLAQRRAESTDSDPESDDSDPLMKLMTKIAGQVVPIELVCPPIPLDRLHILDPVVDALRSAGALGTEQSMFYAFGLHLNPEVPDFDPGTLEGYLQAFVICQDWMIEKLNVDFSRRVTPYIDLFPVSYANLVLGYRASVSLERLIQDYLEFNPTRNRALDMLPLFKHLDESAVMNAVGNQVVNARPTFHYRLPNCEIERPDWSLAESWNLWCVIEYLAENHGMRQRLIDQVRTRESELFNFSEKPWHQDLDKIHQDLLSG